MFFNQSRYIYFHNYVNIFDITDKNIYIKENNNFIWCINNASIQISFPNLSIEKQRFDTFEVLLFSEFISGQNYSLKAMPNLIKLIYLRKTLLINFIDLILNITLYKFSIKVYNYSFQERLSLNPRLLAYSYIHPTLEDVLLFNTQKKLIVILKQFPVLNLVNKQQIRLFRSWYFI